MHSIERHLYAMLGPSLLALYAVDCSHQLGWYRPATPWLAVVADNLPLDRIHAMLATLRASDEAVLTVVRAGQLQAYLTLNPMMGHCVTDSAETHAAPFTLPAAPALSIAQQTAYIALQLMAATRLLFPQVQIEADKEKQTALLNGLANAFDLEQSIPATMIAAIHRAVTQRFGETDIGSTEVCEDVSPVPFRLCAVYEELDTAILVVPDSIVPQIATIDWSAVIRLYQSQFRHLMVTTVSHLRLIAHYELAPAFFTGQYVLNWGRDMLQAQPFSLTTVVRQVQRHIVKLQTEVLSTTCLGMDEPQLRQGLHALQNQLLKIQLQYEVLCLHGVMAVQRAPQWRYQLSEEPLTRMKRIERHLAAWYRLYDEVLQTLEPDQPIT
ncbi:MAG: hypothetical protein M9965_13130 [Anaerolineae bacterium]|nr:hypothetical protein [Anaerolineae bacterium]